jgi:hypothetical protein
VVVSGFGEEVFVDASGGNLPSPLGAKLAGAPPVICPTATTGNPGEFFVV